MPAARKGMTLSADFIVRRRADVVTRLDCDTTQDSAGLSLGQR